MFSLDDLAAAIAARAGADGGASYTRSLLDKGAAACARKFGEESVEFIVAAISEDNSALRGEAADVLYHLLVTLQARGIAFTDVLTELERRTGRSGLEEKASRPS